MGIKSAIAAELKGDAGVSGLVGAHVYRTMAPRNAPYPRVTFLQIGADIKRHLGGGSNLTEATFQFDCWDDNESGVTALAAAVLAALDNFQGLMGSGGNTATVRATFLSGPSDDFVAPTDARENGIYRNRFDAIVWHR